ncbi:hypothetical protein AArcSl_1655 [Halalkaliarchaeum desulfuricum]|uniref:YtpI-like protein n=1 Tax=Halalkaliarchaeum desulfuricum TaxID=2055893 RepID=A0A343TJL2_9EURY|nr:hypothetical protein [Halalkaliarchaeum desulfuricum]AUX09284.1 hypothetical protein AArcSl_1655 [Halalkaliarchaeum desulfuricum]
MLYELVLAGFAIVLTWLWVRKNPETAERTYGWLERSRKVTGSIIVILLAFTFLQSGVVLLQVVAIVMLILGALYFFVERPDQRVIS